jgi:hypothetical protein
LPPYQETFLVAARSGRHTLLAALNAMGFELK